MIGLAGMFMNGNYEVDPGNWTRLMLNHYREDLQHITDHVFNGQINFSSGMCRIVYNSLTKG